MSNKVYRPSYTAPQTITEDQYRALRAKYDAYHAARGERTCITPEDALLMPEACSNDEISAIERYEFIANPPDRYFAYVKPGEASRYNGLAYTVRTATVTTFSGEKLGEATLGDSYRSNMGDMRRAIRVAAINGAHYYGTYYSDSGDYCRLRMTKASVARLAVNGKGN